MDAIFPLKSKKSIKAVNQAVSNNNAMMRLKIQNALYQQELNRVKAENTSLALEKARSELEAKVALEKSQAQEKARNELEAKVALEKSQAQEKARREHEAKVALEKSQAQEKARREHEAKVALEKARRENEARAQTNTVKQEIIAAPAPAPHKKGMRLNNLLNKLK
jgi:hypothetical protein